MAGITLAQAQAQLDQWLAALTAISSAQEYTISTPGGSRRLVRADLAQVQQQVDYWNGKVKDLSRGSGGIRMRYGVPS
jgi:hypothetical protein